MSDIFFLFASIISCCKSDIDFSKHELKINAIIQTLLLPNGQKTFTEDDWKFKCAMWPNLNWTETQAKQALKHLLKEGKVRELEPVGSGRYEPAATLREEGEGGN